MQFNRQLSRPHNLNFDILIIEEVCLHLHKTQISLKIHTTLRFCTTDEAEEWWWWGGLHKDAKEQADEVESLFWGQVRRRSESDGKGTKKRYTRCFSTTVRTSPGVICSQPRCSRFLLPDRKPTDLTSQFILQFCFLFFFFFLQA